MRPLKYTYCRYDYTYCRQAKNKKHHKNRTVNIYVAYYQPYFIMVIPVLGSSNVRKLTKRSRNKIPTPSRANVRFNLGIFRFMLFILY